MACIIPLAMCFNLASVAPEPMVLNASFSLPLAEFPILPDVSGWWSQYAEQPSNVMVDYRGWHDLDVDGFIAVPDCKRVGDYAQITINDSDWLDVRVFDCMGADGDPSWWKDNHIIGEICYPLALEYHVVRKGGVKGELRWIN